MFCVEPEIDTFSFDSRDIALRSRPIFARTGGAGGAGFFGATLK